MVEALVTKYGSPRFWTFVSNLEKQNQADALRGAYGINSVDVEDLVLKWIAAHK